MSTFGQKRKLRFTLATLLVFTAIIAGGLSHVRTSLELRRVKEELTTARNELAYLDTDDTDHIYAVSLPTYGSMQWRWRIQLPEGGKYRIRSSFAQIPESALPTTSSTHDVFLNRYAQPLPGGQPFILSLAIFKDQNGDWMLTMQIPDSGYTRRIEDPPTWLDAGSFVNWTTNVAGSKSTASCSKDEPLVLLKYRKGKIVPGGVTVDMQPTDGMLIWIERIDRP